MGTPTYLLACWDFGVKLCLGVCVCTCVRCSVFCGVSLQRLPSVGVFSICLGTTEYQQPRLFVQFSAKNGFKCYLACSTLGRPQWWTGTNPLTHALHLPSGADKIKYEGGERSGILPAFCAELVLSPPYAFSGLLVLPGSPAPHFGPPAGERPAWVSRGAWGCLSDTEKGLENLISCHFGCLFFNIDILQFLLFFLFLATWHEGSSFPPPGIHGKPGVLTTGPPGKPPLWLLMSIYGYFSSSANNNNEDRFLTWWAFILNQVLCWGIYKYMYINIPCQPPLYLWAHRQSPTHTSM